MRRVTNMYHPGVCCILVTYGERRRLLQEVIEQLLELEPPVQHVVTVFNGVTYDSQEFVSQFGKHKSIIPVNLPENGGSAHGFSVGITAAIEATRSDYFWLLDDDNKPKPDALEKLISAASLLNYNPEALLLSLREDRWEYQEAAYTGRHQGFRLNAFYNFHLGEMIRNRICRIPPLTRLPKGLPSAPLIEVGYAPYGGLFMHRSWVANAGLPNPDYFVYGDDHEYTSRIIAHGGKIFLCATSSIRDIETSWFQNSSFSCHYLLAPDSPALRVYLGLRNRIATERRAFVDSKITYILNAFIFFLKIMVMSWRCWVTKPRQTALRLGLLIKAVQHGARDPLPPMSESLKTWIDGYEQK